MTGFVPVEAIGPLLYRSWANYPVHNFSYSMAKDIDECGAKTKFSRFQGLAPLLDSAAMFFGEIIESSVQGFYLYDVDPMKTFADKWAEKKNETLKYSKTEGGHASLDYLGKSLMKRFLSEYKKLPIRRPEFQVKLPRDPKATWYKGTRLEYAADCISHPKDEPEILIDFKTAGRAYPESPQTVGYPALDPQLRTGALVSGIRRVCFIVFVKSRSPQIQVHHGLVTEFLVTEIDAWLKSQYEKLITGDLHMRAGVRFPSEHCLRCDYLPKCLGNEALAKTTLKLKKPRHAFELTQLLD